VAWRNTNTKRFLDLIVYAVGAIGIGLCISSALTGAPAFSTGLITIGIAFVLCILLD